MEITVRRNVNSPRYIGTPYSKSVSELHPMGEAVINITATDNDGVCILLPFDWLKISSIKKKIQKKLEWNFKKIFVAAVINWRKKWKYEYMNIILKYKL